MPDRDNEEGRERSGAIDTYLAIVSVRAVRAYSDRPISDESLHRILEAGRATGSSRNTQPWKFYVIRGHSKLVQIAEAVYEPGNIAGAQVAIALALTSKDSFDGGRAFQDMVLAAWEQGIGSSPNGVKDQEQMRRVLGLPEETRVSNVLSLGYPLHPHQPQAGDIAGILQRIKRKPLDELVVWVE